MSTTGPRLSSPDADEQGWISVGPKGASLRLEGAEGYELRAASLVLKVASEDLELSWLGESRRSGSSMVAQPSGFTIALESGDDTVATEWISADWGELRALRGLTVKLTSGPKGGTISYKESELEMELRNAESERVSAPAAMGSGLILKDEEEAAFWEEAAAAGADAKYAPDSLGGDGPVSRDCRVHLSVGGPWFPSGEADLPSGSAHILPSLLASRIKVELRSSDAPAGARLAELTLQLGEQPESLALRGDGGTYGMKVGPTRANELVTLSDPAWVELINRRLRAGETPELGIIASRPGRVKLVSASLDVVRVHAALQRLASASEETEEGEVDESASVVAEDPVWVQALDPADGDVTRLLDLGQDGVLTELTFTTALGPGARPTLLDMPRSVGALRRSRAIDLNTSHAQALTGLRGAVTELDLPLRLLTSVVEGRIELHPDVLGRPSGVATAIWPLQLESGELSFDTRWVTVPLNPALTLDTSRVWLVLAVTEGELSWAFEPGANVELGGVASRVGAGPWTPSLDGWLPLRLHGPPPETPEPPALMLRRGFQSVTVLSPGQVTLRQSELDHLNESPFRLMSLRITPKTRVQLTLRGLRAVVAPA